MRWKPVLNWKWLLAYVLVALAALAAVRIIQAQTPPQPSVEGFLQLGFYDLM